MELTRGWVHLPSASPGPPGPVPGDPGQPPVSPASAVDCTACRSPGPHRAGQKAPAPSPVGGPLPINVLPFFLCLFPPSVPRTPPRPAYSLSAPPSRLSSSGKPTFTLSFQIQSSPTSVHSRVDILTLTRSHLPTHTYRLHMNTDTHILIHTHVYTIPQRHTNTLTHKNTLIRTHAHSRTFSQAHADTHSFTHLDTCTYIYTWTQTLTPTQTHSLIHTLRHTETR